MIDRTHNDDLRVRGGATVLNSGAIMRSRQFKRDMQAIRRLKDLGRI